jgi:hypothetical protein
MVATIVEMFFQLSLFLAILKFGLLLQSLVVVTPIIVVVETFFQFKHL